MGSSPVMSTLGSPLVPWSVSVQLPLPFGNLLLFRIERFGVIHLRYGLKVGNDILQEKSLGRNAET